MGVAVRVLLLGASAHDAAPLVRELERAGYTAEVSQADLDRAILAGESPPTFVVVRSGAESIGEHTAAIAHDLRNVVLFPLAMQLELAERAVQANNPTRLVELVAEMAEMLRHAESTIDRLRQLGRQTANASLHRQRVHPDQLANRAAEIARAHLRRRGRTPKPTYLLPELAATGHIDVDAHEVVAALVNVLVNAIDVLHETGGTIALRTGSDDRSSWYEIADDGPGIPDDVRRRLFEPFFTTKGENGTGLGLAMVQACMRRHGGSVELDTEVGTGTQFRLRFPTG